MKMGRPLNPPFARVYVLGRTKRNGGDNGGNRLELSLMLVSFRIRVLQTSVKDSQPVQ